MEISPLGMLLTIPLLSFAAFYGLRFYINKRKTFLPSIILSGLLIVFLLLLMLWIVSLVLSKNDVYIKGYRSMSLIFIAMSFSGFLYFLFLPEKRKMSIPLIGLKIIALISFGLGVIHAYIVCEDYNRLLYYNDKTYRLEKPITFISPCRLPELFVKDCFLERRYKLDEGPGSYCLSKNDIVSVSLDNEGNKTVKVSIYHKTVDGWKDMPNPIVRIVNIK